MKKKYIIIIILIILALTVISLILIQNKTPQFIGGCAGVSLEYLQECCNNYARDNNLVIIQCVGKWEIKNNECSWVCD